MVMSSTRCVLYRSRPGLVAVLAAICVAKFSCQLIVPQRGDGSSTGPLLDRPTDLTRNGRGTALGVNARRIYVDRGLTGRPRRPGLREPRPRAAFAPRHPAEAAPVRDDSHGSTIWLHPGDFGKSSRSGCRRAVSAQSLRSIDRCQASRTSSTSRLLSTCPNRCSLRPMSSSSAHYWRARKEPTGGCAHPLDDRRSTYRLIYRIDDTRRLVTVVGVVPRADAYLPH